MLFFVIFGKMNRKREIKEKTLEDEPIQQLHFLETLSDTIEKGADLFFEPEQAPLNSPEQRLMALDALAQTCTHCELCPLSKSRTKSVFSDGNPLADIMVIGEGPGYNEDMSGIPFVGKAGQLLTKMLKSVNLGRQEDVYITNIVKCRPPNNRTPLPEEMATCLPFLEQQIELIRPRIIILAGGTAARGLLKTKQGITRIRGKWEKWKGIWVMPTFHPSYLLRNEARTKGSPKYLAWQDLKSVMQIYGELKSLKSPGEE